MRLLAARAFPGPALAPAVLALLLAACSAPASRPARGPAPAPGERPMLVLPLPSEQDAGAQAGALANALANVDVGRALSRLEHRRRQGDVEAGWTRVHYLLDLFDDARFRPHGHSVALLHAALRTADGPVRGREATDAVLDALLVAVDQLLAADRLHARAQAARTLLAFDAEPPATRAEAFQRIAELKPIARGQGHAAPLADNARLRLYGYCRQALVDAMRARWADRVRLAAHCLLPLYEADPAPYFAADPAHRPPPPRGADLVADLTRLIEPVAAGPGRLRAAGQALAREQEALAAAVAAGLPALPDVEALGLPRMAGAALYDYTPLRVLTGEQDLALPGDVDALTREVQGDGRRTLTVAVPGPAPARLVHRAMQAARAAGARWLALAGLTEQALVVPPGDYWSGRLADPARVPRLAVLTLGLADSDQDSGQGREPIQGATANAGQRPRATTRNALGLHLLVGPDAWVLAGNGGLVARLAPGTTPGTTADAARDPAAPAAALRAALDQVARAFADEDTVVLVPDPAVPVAALVAAAEAVVRAGPGKGQGQPGRFRAHLAERAPASMTPAAIARPGALARRIERRAGAAVDLMPQALAPRAPAVRRCYQDVLAARPRAGGEFRLELRGSDVAITAGPADRTLRRCVHEALAPLMREHGMASATATLRPAAAP